MLKNLKAFLKSPLDLVKGEPLTRTLPIVGIFVVLGVVPPLLSGYYLSILREVLMWTAFAASWYFFSGSTKYISLGSAAFFGIGMYFTAKFMELLTLPVIVLLGGLVCFGLALVIGLVTLRLRGIYFAILTFSVSMVVVNVIQWWEIKVTGTRGTYIPVFFDSLAVYYTIFICTIVVLLLTTLLRRSKFGLALKMIGESEEAAVHVGVNASIHKTLGFAISAMLIGFMGAGFTTRLTYINTEIAFDPLYSFLPAVMTLLGGAGTVYGPIIGSATLTLIEDVLSVTLVHYFLIILGLLLIVIVMLMPDGIMGMVEKIRTTKVFGSKKS